MTHRQECLCYCIDHLESRSLAYVFDIDTFNKVFEQQNNPAANYYRVGISAADTMIKTYVPQTETASND